MATIVETGNPVPWWKEPTTQQWHAWAAAWLGWTLDAFDFTIFLLIMVPIAQSFHVSLPEVTAVFTLTLWGRFIGATGAGWFADRIGRKTPLMISIAWYSVCNLVAGLAPNFFVLFFPRAARYRHGRGMAGRRVAGDGDLAGAFAAPSWARCCRDEGRGGAGSLTSPHSTCGP
jgi:MFS family permease